MATKRRRYTREARVVAHDTLHEGYHGRVTAHHGTTAEGEPLYAVFFDRGDCAGIFRESQLSRERAEKPQKGA